MRKRKRNKRTRRATRGERRTCEVVKWRKGGIQWLCFQNLKVEKISEAFLGKNVPLQELDDEKKGKHKVEMKIGFVMEFNL